MYFHPIFSYNREMFQPKPFALYQHTSLVTKVGTGTLFQLWRSCYCLASHILSLYTVLQNGMVALISLLTWAPLSWFQSIHTWAAYNDPTVRNQASSLWKGVIDLIHHVGQAFYVFIFKIHANFLTMFSCAVFRAV